MRRLSLHTVPALIAAAMFAFGIFVGRLAERTEVIILTAGGLLLLAALYGFLFTTRSARPAFVRSFLVLTLPFVLGALKLSLDTSSVPIVSDEFIRRPATVVGTVLDPSPPRDNRQQFLFQADSLITANGHVVPMRSTLLVTLTRQRGDSLSAALLYGRRAMLKGQVYRPARERNPGEFDARAYYEAQGIGYMMRIRGHANVVVLDSTFHGGIDDWMMKAIVLPLRFFTLSLIDRTIGGEEGELLKGILIGERGGIPFSTRTAFVHSGIAHILAVSGSNVVVVYACFTTLFGLLRIPRTGAMLLNALMLVLYMLLTGSQPPIVRATVMALVILFSRLLGGRPNSLNAVGVAALIVLAYDARQLFDVGFQLSFAAVVSIIYFYPALNTHILKLTGPALWRRTLVAALQVCAVTLVASVGTLPLTAIYFGKVSVVGIFTNIVILPLVGVSVTLGFVSALLGWITPLAEAVGAVNVLVLRAILETAKYSGGLSWAFVETFRFKPVHAVPFYLVLLWLFHLSVRRVSRVLLIVLLCCLNIFLILPEGRLDALPAERLRVSFIDVGQGDAALVEFPGGRTMLIDAGAWSEEYDAGEQIVTPFLKRRGITRLDWFVASHPHADHIGGAPHVFRSFEVNEVVESGQPAADPAYARYVRAIEQEHASLRIARSFDSVLTVAGVRVYVCYPTAEVVGPDSSNPYRNINNTSVVLKLVYGESAFLFMGDLEREGEAQLCRMFGDFLRADVLKVGHHGSSTSSTEEMLEFVRPHYAVISVGRNNTFNHPSEDVIDRLRAFGADVLRTDEEGAVIFETDGRTLERVAWR